MRNEIIDEVVNKLQEDFDFVGCAYDRKGKFVGNYVNHSSLVSLLPTWADSIKEIFPNFKVTHLYLQWYCIGFNKNKMI